MANMNMTVQTPGLQNLFNVLSGGLGGSASDLIQADLNKARRDQIGVETDVTRADLAAKNKQAESLAALQQILMDPAIGTTPAGRANLISILAGVPDGLEQGPSFGLGATTFVNPEAMTPGELSQAAFGTGVQTDYSKSPDGVLAGLMNAFDIAKMEDQGETRRAMLPKPAGTAGSTTSATPPLVNGGVIKTINDLITQGYGAQYPGASVDPALAQSVATRAAELYQQTRNAQLAVSQAMEEVGAALEGQGGGFFGIGASPGTVRAPKPMSAPAAAAPAAPAGGTPTAVNPTTGERLVLRDGQWVPL